MPGGAQRRAAPSLVAAEQGELCCELVLFSLYDLSHLAVSGALSPGISDLCNVCQCSWGLGFSLCSVLRTTFLSAVINCITVSGQEAARDKEAANSQAADAAAAGPGTCQT